MSMNPLTLQRVAIECIQTYNCEVWVKSLEHAVYNYRCIYLYDSNHKCFCRLISKYIQHCGHITIRKRVTDFSYFSIVPSVPYHFLLDATQLDPEVNFINNNTVGNSAINREDFNVYQFEMDLKRCLSDNNNVIIVFARDRRLLEMCKDLFYVIKRGTVDGICDMQLQTVLTFERFDVIESATVRRLANLIKNLHVTDTTKRRHFFVYCTEKNYCFCELIRYLRNDAMCLDYRDRNFVMRHGRLTAFKHNNTCSFSVDVNSEAQKLHTKKREPILLLYARRPFFCYFWRNNYLLQQYSTDRRPYVLPNLDKCLRLIVMDDQHPYSGLKLPYTDRTFCLLISRNFWIVKLNDDCQKSGAVHDGTTEIMQTLKTTPEKLNNDSQEHEVVYDGSTEIMETLKNTPANLYQCMENICVKEYKNSLLG